MMNTPRLTTECYREEERERQNKRGDGRERKEGGIRNVNNNSGGVTRPRRKDKIVRQI